jgi:hypothetical protein
MDYIQPKIIQSPISGEPIRPQIKTYIKDGKEITEAIYTDPASGSFVRKGIVSVREIKR